MLVGHCHLFRNVFKMERALRKFRTHPSEYPLKRFAKIVECSTKFRASPFLLVVNPNDSFVSHLEHVKTKKELIPWWCLCIFTVFYNIFLWLELFFHFEIYFNQNNLTEFLLHTVFSMCYLICAGCHAHFLFRSKQIVPTMNHILNVPRFALGGNVFFYT